MSQRVLLRATPAARSYAYEHGIDLREVRGTGQFGRVHKADVVDFNINSKIHVSPLAKKIADMEGINLNVIKGKGPKGKIMKDDVLALMGLVEEEKVFDKVVEAEKPAKPQAQKEVELRAAKEDQNLDTNRFGLVETIAMSPMRKVISKRMKESYFSAPSFVVNIDVDMTNMLQLRKQSLDSIMEQTGKKATVTDYISFAVIKALMKHPTINSSLSKDEQEISLHHYVNLAIAVGTDTGLLVPVVKGADKMSLSELVLASKDVTSRALSGKLRPEEMAESTFTISNLGMYGVKSFVPIINQPNNAILGISATSKQAVVINDEIVIRPMMGLTLTCDHRVIDGLEAAKFMQSLKNAIENPIALLI